ncbi:PCP degradation transcriptional activation protein [Methylobacterium crusticola]|uniref:PCP degradation transcriptional activation protein n=1 Tax=Methylobacterium crusticola TaxID=1697972 RepID=A0ABQ4R850_9HYPH|nr:LysR family transcriptional regulator [Methylobacterium crusticola]GJD53907.1 PCP degradation transcriptional activation protein [Methylobacterium crusticola]
MLKQVDLSRVDLNLLVLFEAVLAERHVGRAADRLSLSPSAVSHGLGRLRRLLNDPLFLRTPRGVVPTARAEDLSAAVADALARVRSVVASAEPFDPATSRRRFTIGAPDGVSAVILPPLLQRLRQAAPSIDLGICQLLPTRGETSVERAWLSSLLDLEACKLDAAVIPSDDVPARFAKQVLYEEDFVIAARAGHSFAADPNLDRYCAMQHLLVSVTGDGHGFVDRVLGEQGRTRRIALTVPNFLFALAVVAETDLLCALPRCFAATYAGRFGVVAIEAPAPLGRFRLNAVTTKAALMDEGLAWMLSLLSETRPASIQSA